jgi:hypothetical protein
VDLHFWDSPDDILGADMDLLFERDRVYLHKATGSFGAIPLSVSGEAAPQVGGAVGMLGWEMREVATFRQHLVSPPSATHHVCGANFTSQHTAARPRAPCSTYHAQIVVAVSA